MKKLFINPQNKKILAAAAAIILALGASCALYLNIAKQPPASKPIPLVRTIIVGENQPANAIIYPGEVRGRYESQLAFQVTGKINSRQVNVGDYVQAGQVLMSIDPKDINQSVEAASAQLSSARANQRLAADNAARYNTLYANGAVSEAMRDQYNTQLEAANAALRQAQAQANTSSNQLGYTQLLSDTDGVVAAINGEAGQVAAAGAPMVTIVRSGEREIQINVPENAQLQIGQQAQISFWALPDITAVGHVREIAPMADPVTRTYKVCIAVDRLPEAAKLGMTAKASFAKALSVTQHYLIPAAALYQINNKPQVWVVRSQRAQLADITISGYDGNSIIVSSGLTQGDTVITAGLSRLTPNQEVRLAEGGDMQ